MAVRHQSVHFANILVVIQFQFQYQFFIPNDLQAQSPMCATRGAGLVGKPTYPSNPNTTVNVMRPKWPSWTSPLAKANRTRPFVASTLYLIPASCWFVLDRLSSKYNTRAYCVNFHAPFTFPHTKPRPWNTASTPD
jgi:hypothetical protein